MMKEVDTLLTVTPVFLTSLGKRPSTPDTRFCTSTAAMSSGRVNSKTMVMELLPSLPLVENHGQAHAFDAIDRLFQQRSHGGLDSLRIRARIVRVDRDLRRG